jgi:transcriptional regulator with XRE-family HTH domain
MEPRVPKSIKQQVIKQWLQGTSRDQIAKDNGISAGTVSAIIKDAKQEIPDIDLLREVALLLKNEDLDLSVLADSIRLKNKIDEMDLSEDLVESFIENINIHCFKHGMKAEEFINIINNVSVLSEKQGMPLDQLPNYLIQKELEVEKMNGEIKDAEIKLLQVLQHYNVTMDDLEEYKRNIPLIDYIKQLKTQLEEEKQNIINLVKKLSNEQLENAKWLQKWRMLP